MNEYNIKDWLSKGCPIDTSGVGTKFITSQDSPYLDMAYKLVEYESKPVKLVCKEGGITEALTIS